ncbi:hypothetical protein F5148DRAFT_1199870 [Russula earlei]|uniref:Uncharacterized protein n=1 Tax=Russula earlei TaxID=71964 RepID=A0ACC0UAY9_9AGAM|nr:hypothetical protein F5148DRAFT_1199870 [Russula earlei]
MACLNFDWFIINNMYCSKLCLLYPPHMIAITVIYLTLVLNDKRHDAIQAQSVAHTPPPRCSSHTNIGSMHQKPTLVLQQDFVGFIVGLCMSLPTVVMIAGDPLTLHTVGALLRCCPRVWVQR